MIVCGIDPSLSNTAVCLNNAEPFTMATHSSKASERTVIRRIERFEDLVARIMAPLEDAGTFDVICIEGYAHNKSTGHAHALAEFGGILRFHLVTIAAQIFEVPPMTLKKFCAGNAGPGKTGVIAALTRDYDVQFKTDDEYDAFGLYRMALVLAGGAECRTRAQREAIDTLLGMKTKTREEQAEKALEKMFTNPPPF